MPAIKQDKQRQQKLAQHNKARVVAEAAAAQAVRRRRLMIIGGSLVVVLLIATGAFALTSGSSSSPSSDSDVATGTPVTTSKPAKTSALGDDCVARTGTLPTGSPEVYVPVGPPTTELQVTDLSTGSGVPVAANDTVTVNYTGVACSTGKIFDSSWRMVRRQPLDSTRSSGVGLTDCRECAPGDVACWLFRPIRPTARRAPVAASARTKR